MSAHGLAPLDHAPAVIGRPQLGETDGSSLGHHQALAHEVGDMRRAHAPRCDDGERRPRARSAAIQGPDAVLNGELVVGDPAAFASLLANGVGRHKAYGYGMLMLRPALRAHTEP